MPTTRIGIAITYIWIYVHIYSTYYISICLPYYMSALSEHVNSNHTFHLAATRHSGISINKCRTASTRLEINVKKNKEKQTESP